jgi:hypothetical protein
MLIISDDHSPLIPGTNLSLLSTRPGEPGRLKTCERKLIVCPVPKRSSMSWIEQFRGFFSLAHTNSKSARSNAASNFLTVSGGTIPFSRLQLRNLIFPYEL